MKDEEPLLQATKLHSIGPEAQGNDGRVWSHDEGDDDGRVEEGEQLEDQDEPAREPAQQREERESYVPDPLRRRIYDRSVGPFPLTALFIIVVEACERFSYYGMKAALGLYLTTVYALDPRGASALQHGLLVVTYAMPLVGGVLSDAYIGRFRTIKYLGMVYCAGQILIAVTSVNGIMGDAPPIWPVIVGNVIVGLGSGGIKPCVSTFGAEQYRPGSEDKGSRVEKYFAAFYFAINTGAMVSMILIPILRSKVACFGSDQCYPLAFGLPAILMVLAMTIFLLGSRGYRRVAASGRNALFDFAGVLWASIRRKDASLPISFSSLAWLDRAKPTYSDALIEDVRQLIRVVGGIAFVPFFWAAFDMQHTRWLYQATSMDRVVYFGDSMQRIPSDLMASLNAILVLLFLPLSVSILYPLLRKCGVRMHPLQRIWIGLILMAGAHSLAAVLQSLIDQSTLGPNPDDSDCHATKACCLENCVSVLWQIPQFAVLTLSEVFISVTGLEFAFDQSPLSMRGVASALWLLSVAFGNILVVILSAVPGDMVAYLVVVAMLLLAALGSAVFSRKYSYVNQGAAAKSA